MSKFGFWGCATVAACAVLVGACTTSSRGERERDDGGGVMIKDDAGMSAPERCTPGGPDVVCDGTVEVTCNDDGSEASRQECREQGKRCAPGIGCATCLPGRGKCDGNKAMVCREDGSGYDMRATCDPSQGQSCQPSSGTCVDLCEEAVANNSYIGCEYWPTVTSNSSLTSEFQFAVVVSNPQEMEAQVTVTRGGSMTAQKTVPAGEVKTIQLPWVDKLKNTASDEEKSALVQDGAYRLQSSVPVTVYQFNPLQFEKDGNCESNDPMPLDGKCFSHTNDASLLLPTHVLTGNYMALSRPTLRLRQGGLGGIIGGGGEWAEIPGFVAVVGVESNPVDVEVRFSAHTRGSADGSVSSHSPGDTDSFTLEQGDVLQLVTDGMNQSDCPGSRMSEDDRGNQYCRMGEDYDLTGSEIRASGKVAVISGHNCTFVPHDRWACDHLEEAMFPLETWGKNFLVSRTKPVQNEPNVVRLVSGKNNNEITVTPSSVQNNTTLNRGDWVEFETNKSFQVQGSKALMAVQYLYGQGQGMGEGDPSMSLAIPTEQFRNSYDFLAPSTFSSNLVNVTANEGQQVMLDGDPVQGWQSVGNTGLRIAQVQISGGAHHIESGEGFGIVVYGTGSYTSYMYPGGLDLNMINVPF